MSDDPKVMPELENDDLIEDFEDSLFPRNLTPQDERDLETLKAFNY